jgi:hypothetical protein
MVARQQIQELINPHLTKVLLIAQSSLSESQFEAFRKLFLDEFGKNGLGKELDRVFKKNYKER